MTTAAWYASHREQAKAYRDAHKADMAIYNASRNAARKLAVMNAYGGPKCACCGEALIEGLTIDHIGGNGASHRREMGIHSGTSLYYWLEKKGFPPGFQVLCYTCNCAKGTDDHCPHQDAIGWGER